jgi:hypothetical protein
MTYNFTLSGMRQRRRNRVVPNQWSEQTTSGGTKWSRAKESAACDSNESARCAQGDRCGLRPVNSRTPGQDLRRPARGRRGGGFEYHVSILPEVLRLAIYQYHLPFAAGPASAVPPAASSPLETATAPGRDLTLAECALARSGTHPRSSQDWRRTCAGASRGTCGAAQDRT